MRFTMNGEMHSLLIGYLSQLFVCGREKTKEFIIANNEGSQMIF